MIEQYRGYEIRVNWSNIQKGFVFCIFSLNGEGIRESAPYSYEDNALLGAKETIDMFVAKRERKEGA